MAARIFYQEDCNLSVLEGQKIAKGLRGGIL